MYSSARRLRRSFCVSLGAVILVIGIVGFTAKAANYSTFLSTAVNWTATSVWGCSTQGVGDTCGTYPGQFATPFGNNVNITTSGGPATITVNSSIGNAVTLTNVSGSPTLDVAAGGTLPLTGSSSVSSGTLQVSGGSLQVASGATLSMNAVGSPTSTLSLTSGSILNGGQIFINTGTSFGAVMNWGGGSVGTGGTLNIQNGAFKGTLNLTGANGLMTLDGGTINNAGTTNYSAPVANYFQLINGATFNNNGTGSFGITTDAPINGGTGGLFNNAGTFNKTGGINTPVNIVFNNTQTVNVFSTSQQISFNQGGTHSAATWGLGTTGQFNFNGAGPAHTFTNAETFTGSGTVQFTAGSTNIGTNMTIPDPVTNSGATLFLGNGTNPFTLNVTGNYTQTAGSLTTRLNGAAAGQFGVLNVSGAANFGGTLNVQLGFTPTNGQTFNVVNYASRTGTMAYTPVAYPGGVLVANYQPAFLQLVATPTVDIKVSKTGPSTVNHNQTATYTVTLNNLSAANGATNIVITDSFSSGTFNAAASNPLCSLSSPGTVTCTIPSLPASSSTNLAIAIDATTVGTINNTATLTSLSEVDTNSANNSASSLPTIVNPVADLSVTKSGPATVVAGAPMTYSLAVSNAGPDAASSVVVTDTLPSGLTAISAVGTGWTCSVAGSVVTCNLPSLAIGSAAPITISANAPSAGGTITNSASVSSSMIDSVPANNTSNTVTTTVTASADLQITKSGPPSATAGQNIVYTITVKNLGPSDATGVSVTDTPPAGTTFVANAGACTTAFPCSLGTITAGSTVTMTSTYAVASSAIGPLTNTATVSSSTSDPTPGNNTASVTTPVATSADLSIVKSLTSTLIAGSNATYSIVVTNNGPSDATGVTVTDPTPPGTTFVSNTGACTTPFPCSIGTLTAGSSATITTTFLVASSATGSISNTASVSATTADPNSLNNSSTATGTIGTNADVQITKSGPATANPGQNVTFFISILNNGPSSATGVTVADPTPAGMTFVSNTGGCTTPFPCTIGSLGAGGSAGISSTYTIATTASGTLSNTASVSSTSTDPNAANNSSTATVAINAASDLSIVKSGPANASPGQTITYAVTVTNNGPSPSAPVTVSDPTPAGFTFISNSGACTTAYPCSIGSLSAGQTVSIATTYTVSATAGGPITNTASVSSATPDPVAGNNSSSVTTTVSPKADLTITKSGPATLPASGPITFNIVVKNNGPSTANNLFVNDSPGPGLAFVGNSGGCSTPFPCSFATLAAGASITIQSKFNVSSGVSSVTNTADVNSSTADPNNSNNSSTVTVSKGSTCPNGTLTQFQPFSGQTDVPAAGVMQWTNVGATTYEVYMGAPGSGCSALVATVNGTSYSYTGLTPNTDYESRIVAVQPGCPSIGSACIRWRTASGGCNLTAPVLQSPAAGTTVGGSTTLKWSAVPGATSYHVVIVVNGVTQVDTTTSNTSLDVTIPNGNATWSVTAISGNCTSPAANGTFTVCGAPQAPLAGVVGAPTSGNTYSVIVVVPPPGVVSYDFQEATDASFGSVITQNTNSTSVQYSHTTNVPQVFFYRVRAIGACTNSAGPFSKPVRVVIVPAVQDLRNPKVNVPAGNKNLVVIQVFIPGDSVRENFAATSDRPWVVRIDPSSGILPPEGITLNVTIDPSQLPNGTFTATVLVSTSPISGSSRLATNGSGKSVPVSINLITPVVPVNPNAPTADSIFIPAVGHLAGLNSQWRSDIRIYNASPQTLQYLLNFTPQGSTEVKQTTITTLSGDTTALDDIIHNWFGVGEVGDSSTGVLEIRPMTTDGSTTPPKGSSFTTVASSRTFNATSDGTVGQFIPPVAFSNFIGGGSRLSMQQLAQSQAYRTNFGLLEGSGAPVSLVLSMFSSAGTKLFDLPVDLAAGEQKLLNGLLAEKGVTVNDGRMEVKVANGNGKVTAYASVIDNASLDPQLVPGQNLAGTTSKLYVVPGVADLNNGVASWRTDMRVYNSGNAPQSTDLAFYPQDKASPPFFATLTVNPNEVKVLDSVIQSLFGTHDVGGMVQLTTPADSQLVVTARTYNQTANGTLGQFIKAATAAEGITTSTRALNILQVEDSPRFRTNVGLAEMTGKPVTVEVSVILPDSKVTPSIQVPLAANEFRQFGVAQLGLGNIYNARVSVKVIDGSGSVTAYGSVIDQVTTDPTYVQAQ